MSVLVPVISEAVDLAPVVCVVYPPSGVLTCAPDVICGQWRVGQAKTEDDTGWGPVACSPLDLGVLTSVPLDLGAVDVEEIDLVPLVCEEA